MKRIVICHYAGPPVVGGVESTIAHQARGLAQLGYQVCVLAGRGAAFDQSVETHLLPLLDSTHPDILQVKSELDAGIVSASFASLAKRISDALRPILAEADICIAHNLLTLHKNLPLTAALARLHADGRTRLIGWCYDLAWTNDQYQAELHAGYPWELLRQAWPDTRYVTISETRRAELAGLMNVPPESITVIAPGLDVARFLRWTPVTYDLVHQLNLLDADGLLLMPARLTRRKNVELALRVLAEMRRLSGRDFRLIVTGPPGPHNPANHRYLDELQNQRRILNLERTAHLMYLDGGQSPCILDDDTISDLYRLADGLLLPSLQEGFGIPVLEAGLSGLPVFCSDIPPFRETAGSNAMFFDPINEPAALIAARILDRLADNATYHLRVHTRQRYRWEVLMNQQIAPLVEES